MNTRDCPHGRMVAKCADCDVIELEADNNALRALNAELVEALRRCRDMVGHPDNVAFIDAALAKVEGKA